jgi:nucleotide-binding universal stress UspA family protein
MFKNIILATDGSGHATKAAEYAADIAAKYAARLTVVTVLPNSLPLEQVERMPQAGRFPQSVKDEIKHYEDAFAGLDMAQTRSSIITVPAPSSAIVALGEEILNEAGAVAKGRGVAEIKHVALYGNPAEAISEAAAKIDADLIVMGTRGLTDLGGILMGSVSHKVIHLAHRPCLTVA